MAALGGPVGHRKPSARPWHTCFYLLRVGAMCCVGGGVHSPHLSPATQDHPGMASPLTTVSEPTSRSSPPPSACSNWAGGPAPGPFPAHCGFALDAAENTAPAPHAGPPPPPRGHQDTAGPCPSGTLGHTRAVYPVPTRSPCPVGSLYYAFIEEPTPHPLQFQSLTQRWLKLSPELKSPRARMTDDGI